MELRDLPRWTSFPFGRRSTRRRRGARVLARARDEIRAGGDPGDLQARLAAELAASAHLLRRALNATGVIAHTNLGRAPLGSGAERVHEIAPVLEPRVRPGRRCSRLAPESCRRRAPPPDGAEAALVVNNTPRWLLALAALARARGPRSRGPADRDRRRLSDPGRAGALGRRDSSSRDDQPGTRVADYGARSGRRPRCCCACTSSNFRVVGFTERPACAAGPVAQATAFPLVDDLGSAPSSQLEDEPSARDAARRRGGSRVLLGRQAARRPAGGFGRRPGGAGRAAAASSTAARAPVDKLTAAARGDTPLYLDPERARREIPPADAPTGRARCADAPNGCARRSAASSRRRWPRVEGRRASAVGSRAGPARSEESLAALVRQANTPVRRSRSATGACCWLPHAHGRGGRRGRRSVSARAAGSRRKHRKPARLRPLFSHRGGGSFGTPGGGLSRDSHRCPFSHRRPR